MYLHKLFEPEDQISYEISANRVLTQGVLKANWNLHPTKNYCFLTAANSGDLKFGKSPFQMVKKRLVSKWSRFGIGSIIWEPNHLKSEQMAALLSPNI